MIIDQQQASMFDGVTSFSDFTFGADAAVTENQVKEQIGIGGSSSTSISIGGSADTIES